MRSFLSHSSKDKKSYVEIVARTLGTDNCIYDALSFEEGMKTFEEILKGLQNSDILVFFISDSALESEWVKKEIERAYDLLKSGNLKKFFPIIIDKSIRHTDVRIPQWMRDEYNLRYVSQPTVAARRIRQRLREVAWDYHPRLKEKQKLFSGRNELTEQFESRINDIDKAPPSCVIASGIPDVGRRTFLRRSFIKTALVDEAYEFPVISLGMHDSIEDFIHELYDLGFASDVDIKNLLKVTVEEKIKIAVDIIKQIQAIRERVLVVDNGCIITHERKVVPWFDEITKIISSSKTVNIAVVSRYRVKQINLRGKPWIFALEVPELDIKERGWLLKRYSEFEELSLTSEDLNWFLGLLNGFPEQVFFAVDIIKTEGIDAAKKHSHDIVEFNKERASQVVEKYQSNQSAIEFLAFLSEFEFISIELISDVVDGDVMPVKLLEEFVAGAICEMIGANKEYVRVNDTIKDFVRRGRIGISSKYKQKLEEHVNKFIKTYKYEEKDVSDYLFSVKEALVRGEIIDDTYLIPSHFVRTIKDLYDQHNRYDEVIKLSDRILLNVQYLDDKIIRNIRYYLCLALARKKSDRFLNEVQHIDGPEHNFLMGFYYRLGGRYKEAVERFEKALEDYPNFSRAKRDLVQVYLSLGDFERAKELSKENYEENKSNPYHIQAYFHCMLMGSKPFENDDILSGLIDDLGRINVDQAREMYLRSKAQYLAFNQGKVDDALDVIQSAIQAYDSPYAKFAKFEICERYNKLEKMEETLSDIENSIDSKSYFFPFVKRYKCLMMLHKNGKDAAMRYLMTNLKEYPPSAIERIRRRIETHEA